MIDGLWKSESGYVDSMGVALLDWTPEEARAWESDPIIPTAEWVSRYMRLPEDTAALAGRIDLGMTPYLRGPFDAVDDPYIETITLVSGTQLGKSTFLHGCILSGVCQRPGPRLLVLPTEPDAREVAGGDLRSVFEECDRVMRLTPLGLASLKKEGYDLAGGDLNFGWSNSAASLSRRPCREVYLDEVDKYPPYIGQDVDPISLTDKRMRTYRNTTGCKSIRVSSPTVPSGAISVSYEESDQRSYYVPCPHCGVYQVLIWANVRWPRKADGHSAPRATIERDNLAWYQCDECDHQWDDERKNSSVKQGVWARLGEDVDTDGQITGHASQPGRHAGFHISAMYSPFVTLSQLAAAFLKANSTGAIALQDFLNNELGVVFEEKETETSENEMRRHAGVLPKATADLETGLVTGIMDARVQCITAFIDWQKHSWYVAVKGWGFGLESWVLDYREIMTLPELFRYIRTVTFSRAGSPKVKGRIQLTLIDTGDEAAKVYALIDQWRDVDIRGVKGASSDAGPPWRASDRKKDPRTGRVYKTPIRHYTRHPQYFKDWAALLMSVDEPGPGYMHLPSDVSDDYLKQLCSEHKTIDRKRGKTGRSARRPKSSWKVRPGYRANHYWDCEVGNVFAAELLQLRALPDPNQPQQPPKPKTKKRDPWKPRTF